MSHKPSAFKKGAQLKTSSKTAEIKQDASHTERSSVSPPPTSFHSRKCLCSLHLSQAILPQAFLCIYCCVFPPLDGIGPFLSVACFLQIEREGQDRPARKATGRPVEPGAQSSKTYWMYWGQATGLMVLGLLLTTLS